MEPYRLTQRADQDISDHYEYGILAFGLDQAQTYLLGMYDRFLLLADNPRTGRSAEELTPQLRRSEYGAHVIFYMLDDDIDTHILIVRVLRKEMDFRRHI